jgi:hypothetical protein
METTDFSEDDKRVCFHWWMLFPLYFMTSDLIGNEVISSRFSFVISIASYQSRNKEYNTRYRDGEES